MDSRLVFLRRASARLMLLEAGEMSLDEGFAGLFDLTPNDLSAPTRDALIEAASDKEAA